MANLTILNTSILTTKGSFTYEPICLEETIQLVSDGFESAVGHQATADILTTILGVEVKMNRIEYNQGIEDTALVFKLKGRPEEGRILTVEEIEEIGYDFGLIKKTKNAEQSKTLENYVAGEIFEALCSYYGSIDGGTLHHENKRFWEKFYKKGMNLKEIKLILRTHFDPWG